MSRLSIHIKLTSLMAFLVAAIALFVFLFVPAHLGKIVLRKEMERADSIAEMAAFSVAPGLFFEDVDAVQEAFKGVQQNKDVFYLVVEKSSGDVFAVLHPEKARFVGYMRARQGSFIHSSPLLYATAAPIRHNETVIGTLYIGFSLEELRADIQHSRVVIGIVSLGVFLVGVLGVFGVSAAVTRPLKRMARTVERIATGDLTQRAQITSTDEVGDFAASFNRMVEHLQAAQAQLEELNQSLERQVAERTDALRQEVAERRVAEARIRALNATLEGRVAERTAELEQVNRALLRSNTELQQFAYVASHDLREPLRTVSSFLQLLEQRYRDQLDGEAREFIAFAIGGAKRMEKRITALLELSRVETRKQPLVPTDSEEVIRRILDDLHAIIEDKGAVITCDPLPIVLADAAQLSQVFSNLIENALKFSREGESPRIHISACEGETEVVFAVRDNGIGIAPQYFDRIFIIFQRLHLQEAYPGIGIGLAICKKIVEYHGGRIWVESDPSDGTTFFFTWSRPLPRSQSGSNP